jgi:hypothetical protein
MFIFSSIIIRETKLVDKASKHIQNTAQRFDDENALMSSCFFNIEDEDGKGEKGFHFIIGKYSNSEVIDGPKNSYCVLKLNEISHELIEDIAVEKEEVPLPNAMKFKAGGNEVSRIMEYASKCLNSYLESNPKVNRIYDEIQDNLEFEGKGEYIEFMKSIIISYLGENWSVQQGSTKKSVLISR